MERKGTSRDRKHHGRQPEREKGPTKPMAYNEVNCIFSLTSDFGSRSENIGDAGDSERTPGKKERKESCASPMPKAMGTPRGRRGLIDAMTNENVTFPQCPRRFLMEFQDIITQKPATHKGNARM
ncbi:hypothetical protein M413DRAFT_347698 [Hebeloma cylindrosporum]|uniref:Uncharacterized protein n=1 Tax=Hebeloma cylindrosporum TaxID=76867 RepID=A0A0C2XCA2_HEBCY|nr:hypothetical protein M413DRAFT_347698 [Hebeloma cylindrosporum h7]